MDPELMQLFLSAKNSDTGAAGLLKLLTSPQLQLLAGQYDPLAAQGGSAGLTQRYASDPTPAIQQMMQQINSGIDKFALSSYVDSLAGQGVDTGSFQIDDLKSLGNALIAERDGTGPKGSKNAGGLRNPTDLYTTADVPVSQSNIQALSGYMKNQDQAASRLKQAEAGADTAMKDMGPLFSGMDERGRPMAPSAQQMIQYVKGNQQSLPGADSIDWRKVDPDTGTAYSWAGTQSREKRGFADPRGLIDMFTKTPLQAIAKTGEDIWDMNFGKSKSVADYVPQPDEKKTEAYKKAMRKKGLAEQQVNAGQGQEEAYRRGMLRAYAEAGKTPAKDQLAGIMRFLSSTK
jgi:hypothetical protein